MGKHYTDYERYEHCRWETGKYIPIIKARRKLQPYFEKYNIEATINILKNK
mgnify:CR=1 FL=1